MPGVTSGYSTGTHTVHTGTRAGKVIESESSSRLRHPAGLTLQPSAWEHLGEYNILVTQDRAE